MSLWQWVFLAGITFFAFLIKGITGFGNTVVMAPFYVQVVSPTVVTPVDLIFSIPTNAWLFFHNRVHVNVKKMLPVVALMFIGTLPGAFMLKYIHVSWFKLLLGVLIIGIAADRYHHKYMHHGKLSENRVLQIGLSLFSGLTVGMFGIGLPIAAYLTRVSQHTKAFKGQLTFVFLCENLMRAGVYISIGLFTPMVLKVALMMVPSVFIGLYCGMWLSDRINEKYVDYLMIVLLLIIGVNLFASNIFLLLS